MEKTNKLQNCLPVKQLIKWNPHMESIKITNSRAVGNNQLPFIIAEIGNNHNGSMEMAKELIQKAKECGADAVKTQTKNIETAFPKELLDMPYLGVNSFGETYREHKEFLELTEQQTSELKDYADEIGILFFSTPFDINSVDLLEKINTPLYKISSFHVTDLKLIEKVSSTGKPIIISCGMSELEEIDDAVNCIRKYTENFILLQCTSAYPTEFKDVNFNIIRQLKKRYDCLVGYSGHERGVSVSPGAVLMGGCVIERHFTLDRTLKGPDHAASVEPEGLDLLVKRSHNFWHALGNSDKKILDVELNNRKKFRGY